MNRTPRRRIASAGLLGLAIAALGACSPESPAAPTGEVPLFGSIPGGTGAVTTNVVAGETFKVCKVYSGTDGGPVSVRVQVDVGNNTTVDHDFNVSVAGGECWAVWNTGGNGGVTDLVTVTETGPAGYTTAFVTQTREDATVSAPDASVAGTATSETITNPSGIGQDGVVVTFTNTIIPVVVPLPGRMTGGGAKVVSTTGETVSFGLTLHCDITLSNNLEINWKGHKWHLSKPITQATCTDEGLSQPPPVAPFDTFTGVGFGKLDGVENSRIEFVFGDAGEPGKNDLAGFRIYGPNGGPLVFEVVYQLLKSGNLQAHYDQPHGNKP